MPARATPSAVHVLAIGGAHQLPHIIPVACELERRHPGATTIFVPTPGDAEAVRALAGAIGGPLPSIAVMRLPEPMEKAARGSFSKIMRLLAWARTINRGRVVLCAERTSTILPRLFPKGPPMLHIPHGAGDRAVGFERRFGVFEHVLVAGRKDRDRLVAAGVVSSAACTVTGPIKLSSVLRQGAGPAPIFANDRPTILYNPHFSRKYRSIDAFGKKLVEAIRRDGRYNLVVAPHVRLGREWSDRERAAWQALSVPDRIVVDAGSSRSCDMTYTLAADLYIGDVSSQVYEFLIRPRPCLFVDAHRADWRESEDYAMWHLGEVVAAECDPIDAIDRAFAGHARFLQRQKERMAYAIEGIGWTAGGLPRLEGEDPAVRAARIVARYAGLTESEALAAAA